MIVEITVWWCVKRDAGDAVDVVMVVALDGAFLLLFGALMVMEVKIWRDRGFRVRLTLHSPHTLVCVSFNRRKKVHYMN
jgi:hypothetical protein